MGPIMFEHVILLGLAAFAVKHFFCDFSFQTVRMIQEKGYYGRAGGLQHAGIHTAGTLTVLSALAVDPVIATCLALLDGVVHYHIDWAKEQMVRRLNFTPNDSAFWMWLGLDQLMHYLTYIAILAIVVHLAQGV